jgi:hypothetical protein
MLSCFYYNLCASASTYFGVLVLCAGTSLTFLETHVEVLNQVWFVLELIEGISYIVGFLCGKAGLAGFGNRSYRFCY